MREIKFRAWYANEMRPVTGVLNHYYVHMQNGHKGWYDGGLKNLELMQYTGLTDKNGKEIWEGDLIVFEGYGKYEIKWDDESACFTTYCVEKFGLESYMFTNLFECNEGNSVNHAEVIGNIHEHSELLEQ